MTEAGPRRLLNLPHCYKYHTALRRQRRLARASCGAGRGYPIGKMPSGNGYKHMVSLVYACERV